MRKARNSRDASIRRKPSVARGDVVTAFRQFFMPDVMDRGARYFRNGAVEITRAGPDCVQAEVQGSRRYHAGILLDADAAKLWCACPYVARDEEPCKPLWALVQAADAAIALAALSSTKPRWIRLSSSPDEAVRRRRRKCAPRQRARRWGWRRAPRVPPSVRAATVSMLHVLEMT